MSFNSYSLSLRQAQIKEMQGIFDQTRQSGSQRKEKPILKNRNTESNHKIDMTHSSFEKFLKKDHEEHVHEVEESIKSIKENTVRQKESDEELRKIFESWCKLLEEKDNEVACIRQKLDDKEEHSNNLQKQLETIRKETFSKDVLIRDFEVSTRKFQQSMSTVENQLELCKLWEQKSRQSEFTVSSLQQKLESLRKENARLTLLDGQLRELQTEYNSQIEQIKEYEETLSSHKSMMRVAKQREEKYHFSQSQVTELKQNIVLLQKENEEVKQKLLKSENNHGLLQITLMKMENIKSGLSDLESKSKECLVEEKKRMQTELDQQMEFSQRTESQLRFEIQQLEITCGEQLESNKILEMEKEHFKSECSKLKIKLSKLEKELFLFVQAKGELETISNENAILGKGLMAVQKKIYRNNEAKSFSAQQKETKVKKLQSSTKSNPAPATETDKSIFDRLEWAKSEIRKLSADNSRSVSLVAKLQKENQKLTKQIYNLNKAKTAIPTYQQEQKQSENIAEMKSELSRLNLELNEQTARNESLRETILQLHQQLEGYQQQEFQQTRQENLINKQRVMLEQLERKSNNLQETVNTLKMETKTKQKYTKQLENASKQRDSDHKALQMRLTEEIRLIKKNADIAEERKNLEISDHLKENCELQRQFEDMTENCRNLRSKMEDERMSYRKAEINTRKTTENLEDVIMKLKNKIVVNEMTVVKLQNEKELFEEKMKKSIQTNWNVGLEMQEEKPDTSRNSPEDNSCQTTRPTEKLPQQNLLEQTQNANTLIKDTKQENSTTMFMESESQSESITPIHTTMNDETQICIHVENQSMKVEENDEASRLSARERSLEESLKREKLLEHSLAIIQKEFMDRETLLIIRIKQLNSSNITLKKQIVEMHEATAELMRDAEINRTKLEELQQCQAELSRIKISLEDHKKHTIVTQNANAELAKDLAAVTLIKNSIMFDKDQAVMSLNKAKQHLEQSERTEQHLKEELSNTETRYIKEVNQLKVVNNDLENEIKQINETKEQWKSVSKETRSESDKIAIAEFQNLIYHLKLELNQKNEELQQLKDGKESQIIEMENANLKTQCTVYSAEVTRLKEEIEKMITTSIKQKQDFDSQQELLINEIKILERKLIDNRVTSTSVPQANSLSENADRRSYHLTDLEQRIEMLEKLQTTESNDQEYIEKVKESKFNLLEYVVSITNNVRETQVEHDAEYRHTEENQQLKDSIHPLKLKIKELAADLDSKLSTNAKVIQEYETRISSYEALVTTYKKQVETYESDTANQTNALDLFAKEKELQDRHEKLKEIGDRGLESSSRRKQISSLRSAADSSEIDLSSHQEHFETHTTQHKDCEICAQIDKEVQILRCENVTLVEEKKLIDTSSQQVNFGEKLTKSFYQPGIHITIEDSG